VTSEQCNFASKIAREFIFASSTKPIQSTINAKNRKLHKIYELSKAPKCYPRNKRRCYQQ